MLKEVLSLTLSSAIGQAINLVVLIITARILSPEQYGIYTVCLTLAGYIVVISSAKFHHSLFAVNIDEAKIITAGSQIFSFVLAVLGLAILYGFKIYGMWPEISFIHFPLVALAGYFSGISLFFYYFSLRTNSLNKIIKSRLYSPLIGGALMILLTSAGYGSVGVLVGYITSLAAMCFFLDAPFALNNFRELWGLLKKNLSFPLLLLPAGLIETFNASFLLLTTSELFGFQISAALGLYYRLIASPQGMVTTAIGDSIKKKIAESNSKAYAKILLKKTISILFVVALTTSVIIFIAAKPLIPLLLGEKWAYSIPYVTWMVPVFFASLIISPISVVLYIYNGQRYDFYLQCFLGVMYLLVYFIFKDSLEYFIVGFLITTVAKYLLELYFSFRCLREGINEAA